MTQGLSRMGGRDAKKGRRLLTFLFIICLAPVVSAAESVQFTFDPPTPLTYRETVRTTRSDEGPQGPGREITVISRSEIELIQEGEGYKMTVRSEPPKQVRAGREMSMQSNPIMKAIENAVFTYTLDGDGHIQSVEGYEEVVAKIQQITMSLMEQIPEAQRGRFARTVQNMMEMIQPEALVERMRAEWDGRVAEFDGLELEVGETYTSESEFPLPTGGTVKYLNAVKFAGLVPCGDDQCAKIVYQYDTDPSALNDFVGETLEALGGEGPSNTEISGEGERVIDPDTLLIQSETQKRKIVMTMTGRNGEEATMTRNETREFTYDYGEGEATAQAGGDSSGG